MNTETAGSHSRRQLSLKDFLDLGSGCMPEVALRVNSVANQRRAGVHDLENAISMDVAISSRCLAIANSAAYAGEVRVASLRDAVVRLGFSEVVNIALTVGLAGPWQAGAATYKELWHHCLATGLLAKQLATQLPTLDAHKLYIGGLLHDVGRMLFLKTDSRAYCTLVDQGFPSAEQERAHYGFDHVALGVAFATHSRFQEDLVEAIRYHHEAGPEQWNLLQADGVDARPAALVALADAWAPFARSGAAPDAEALHGGRPTLAWLRLDETGSSYLVQAAHAQYQQLLSSLAMGPKRGSQ